MARQRSAGRHHTPIYRRLEPEEFQNRMASSFPAIYLTNVSIIQAVALGILMERTFGYVAGLDAQDFARWAPMLPYALMSFTLIILTSFEYHWFVGMYQWSPKAVDTIAPYAVGVAEIGPLFFLTAPRVWWFLSMAVPIVAAAVYCNTLVHAREDMFVSEEIYEHARQNIRHDIVLTSTIAAVAIVLGITYPRLAAWSPLAHTVAHIPILDLLLAVGYIGGAITLMQKEHHFLSAIHAKMGFRY